MATAWHKGAHEAESAILQGFQVRVGEQNLTLERWWPKSSAVGPAAVPLSLVDRTMIAPVAKRRGFDPAAWLWRDADPPYRSGLTRFHSARVERHRWRQLYDPAVLWLRAAALPCSLSTF